MTRAGVETAMVVFSTLKNGIDCCWPMVISIWSTTTDQQDCPGKINRGWLALGENRQFKKAPPPKKKQITFGFTHCLPDLIRNQAVFDQLIS